MMSPSQLYGILDILELLKPEIVKDLVVTVHTTEDAPDKVTEVIHPNGAVTVYIQRFYENKIVFQTLTGLEFEVRFYV
jgi:hypothetical protein